ncbi:RHS repeat protein, partial [Citrobacter amalonaticus]|nr:RHS repeat protein [Citrobacter amalonaticus]
PLARYAYTPRGELSAVYDRSGTPVRGFIYDDKHPGRMTAHQYAGRPRTTYRYDAAGRVVEQHNPAGLSYTYEYEKNAVTITDSLNRREVLHTEGEGGLKRVVKKRHADGSETLSGYNILGWLTAQTDAAGRKTEYRYSIASGNVTEIVTPDGRSVSF